MSAAVALMVHLIAGGDFCAVLEDRGLSAEQRSVAEALCEVQRQGEKR